MSPGNGNTCRGMSSRSAASKSSLTSFGSISTLVAAARAPTSRARASCTLDPTAWCRKDAAFFDFKRGAALDCQRSEN